jgi:hypothetical protein
MKKLLSNLIPLTNHAIVRILMHHEGPLAQLGERVNGIHEVSGSIPLRSTADTIKK